MAGMKNGCGNPWPELVREALVVAVGVAVLVAVPHVVAVEVDEAVGDAVDVGEDVAVAVAVEVRVPAGHITEESSASFIGTKKHGAIYQRSTVTHVGLRFAHNKTVEISSCLT